MIPKFSGPFFAICLVLSGSAWAGFTIVNPPGAPPLDTNLPPAITPNTSLNNTGYMGNLNPVLPPAANSMVSIPGPGNMTPMLPHTIVNGFGRDIPLSIAVKQIVPVGVRVNFDAGIDASLPVTWHGGKAWQDVLADALRPNSLFVSESANGVTIGTARPPPGYAVQTTTPFGAPPMGMYPLAAATLQPVALPPIVIPTWTAKSSQTLRQTLEEWCKKAGVTLRWDSEYDYPIDTDVSLTGDFETSVRALLRGLKNATPSPVARYYRGQPGVPGVLLVPSPTTDGVAHTDNSVPSVSPQATTPVVLAPITH